MKAILPVAGNGTRMYPLGITTPKCLLPVLNKPLILWTLESLQKAGIDHVIIVISGGKFGQMIRDYVEKLNIPNLKLEMVIQEQQLGTAHVYQIAKDFFQSDEEFIALYGDDLYGPENIKQVIQSEGLAVVGVKVNDPEKWGIFQVDAQNNLVSVIEKPQEKIGDLAHIGCMKLHAKIFELYEQLEVSPRGEYEITDTLNLLAKQMPIKVLSSSDYWIPVGYPWHILEVTEHFMKSLTAKIEGTIEEGVHVHGEVVLPKSSSILHGSYIEGNVVIGENVSIGPNAYIRGPVVIADGAKIGFSVEVKNSVIGRNTQVPHLSYIGDSIIGNNVNFSGQSIVANWRHDAQHVKTVIKGQLVDTGREKFGTVIGDDVKLGIGTKIYPGRKIWPNKTTLPGQVVDKDIIE